MLITCYKIKRDEENKEQRKYESNRGCTLLIKRDDYNASSKSLFIGIRSIKEVEI